MKIPQNIRKDFLVIYRACDAEVAAGKLKPVRLPYFDKLKCWRSFYDSFSKLADIMVVWDGPKGKLSDYILDTTKFTIGDFVEIGSLGNQGSLLYCYQLCKEKIWFYKQIYFCEDDYYFLPRAGEFMLNALRGGIKLFTPCDCIHRYNGIGLNTDQTFGHEYLLLTSMGHIRTVESTTCSVSMTDECFRDLEEDLISFCKKGVGAPEDRSFYREILKKGFRVWCPVPGLATHAIIDDVTPLINWEGFSNAIRL